VARHLVAAGRLLDSEPEKALAHAYAARAHAARIGAVREAVGIAAYLAGEWQVAIAELRAVRRMSGTASHVAILADCERALGRPERALELFRSPEAAKLQVGDRIELLIVASGARRDLGQDDAALVMLQVPELRSSRGEPWLARLRYAYADALMAAGRGDEARDWFALAAEVDHTAETDAAERLLELDGVILEDNESDFEDASDEDTGDWSDDHTEIDADLGDADLDGADLDDADRGDVAGTGDRGAERAGPDEAGARDESAGADTHGVAGGVGSDRSGGQEDASGTASRMSDEADADDDGSDEAGADEARRAAGLGAETGANQAGAGEAREGSARGAGAQGVEARSDG
jgi:tetratricopeptide (TPR) repeat protein